MKEIEKSGGGQCEAPSPEKSRSRWSGQPSPRCARGAGTRRAWPPRGNPEGLTGARQPPKRAGGAPQDRAPKTKPHKVKPRKEIGERAGKRILKGVRFNKRFKISRWGPTASSQTPNHCYSPRWPLATATPSTFHQLGPHFHTLKKGLRAGIMFKKQISQRYKFQKGTNPKIQPILCPNQHFKTKCQLVVPPSQGGEWQHKPPTGGPQPDRADPSMKCCPQEGGHPTAPTPEAYIPGFLSGRAQKSAVQLPFCVSGPQGVWKKRTREILVKNFAHPPNSTNPVKKAPQLFYLPKPRNSWWEPPFPLRKDFTFMLESAVWVAVGTRVGHRAAIHPPGCGSVAECDGRWSCGGGRGSSGRVAVVWGLRLLAVLPIPITAIYVVKSQLAYGVVDNTTTGGGGGEDETRPITTLKRRLASRPLTYTHSTLSSESSSTLTRLRNKYQRNGIASIL
ncbi:hypothetical protein GWK47_047353 [Chionoecetes opilio]|uniref:Uncharacterized protein n=1 Tax=Chionoecetes opilio TaxID=41210 RepID=A0A8J4Y6C3_CHIOP|nr:hypothetical protein GWK47_047353 [Chionoecetes opilio]